ncbi:5317_t:CDS:1 [Scutellospora calospora]|uniref:5317_t:CDS:1 n=1 Tax=Scutellospora calospora TaxID=85575 RepID=A0ACA9K1M3_9GLOM|nr:5317_t:CDS:1 [Scutellospora calospora]
MTSYGVTTCINEVSLQPLDNLSMVALPDPNLFFALFLPNYGLPCTDLPSPTFQSHDLIPQLETPKNFPTWLSEPFPFVENQVCFPQKEHICDMIWVGTIPLSLMKNNWSLPVPPFDYPPCNGHTSVFVKFIDLLCLENVHSYIAMHRTVPFMDATPEELRIAIIFYLTALLPQEVFQFYKWPAHGFEHLTKIYAELPFEFLKSALEAQTFPFEAPIDRFQFAKKVLALRKTNAKLYGCGNMNSSVRDVLCETVYLAFGDDLSGSGILVATSSPLKKVTDEHSPSKMV